MKIIKLDGVDMVELIKTVYELSRPQGLGCIQYTTRPMTDAEAKAIVLEEENEAGYIVFSLDYIQGRTVKFSVFRNTEKGFIYTYADWFDHTSADVDALVQKFGLTITEEGEV